MENQAVENKAPEERKLSLEEVSAWAVKAVEELYSNVRMYTAMTSEQRRQKLISKGFPPELFTGPTHLLFHAEMSYKTANIFLDKLFTCAVIQDLEDQYKTNIFVQLMRHLTWDSFKESLMDIDIVRRMEQIVHEKVHGTARKAPNQNGKYVIPFWFRNFNKQPVKEYIYFLVDRIRSYLRDADNYIKMYIGVMYRQDMEKPKETTHT
jgi:hypothetical protein